MSLVCLRAPLRLSSHSFAFVFAFAFLHKAKPEPSPAENFPQRSGPEATDSIAVALPPIYFWRFQPKNRMSSPETT
jgi:hypothetical protein